MQEKRLLLSRLINRKRVGVSPKNYLKKLQNASIFVLLLVCILSGSIFYKYGLSYSNLAWCSALFLVVSYIVYYLRTNSKSTAVKGDNLIINTLGKSSSVTSLRSVKRVKTSTFLGLHWTRVHYKLDGVTRKVLIFNRASSVTVRPEVTIKKAIELSKKQRQTISRIL